MSERKFYGYNMFNFDPDQLNEVIKNLRANGFVKMDVKTDNRENVEKEIKRLQDQVLALQDHLKYLENMEKCEHDWELLGENRFSGAWNRKCKKCGINQTTRRTETRPIWE